MGENKRSEAQRSDRRHAVGHLRKWAAFSLSEERPEEIHQGECRVNIR